MQASGVPLAPVSDPVSSGSSPPQTPGRAGGGSIDPSFDVLAARQPALPQIPDPTETLSEVSQLQDLILSSPNPFYQELAARILQTGR